MPGGAMKIPSVFLAIQKFSKEKFKKNVKMIALKLI